MLSWFWGDTCILGQEILNLHDPYIQYYCTVRCTCQTQWAFYNILENDTSINWFNQTMHGLRIRKLAISSHYTSSNLKLTCSQVWGASDYHSLSVVATFAHDHH